MDTNIREESLKNKENLLQVLTEFFVSKTLGFYPQSIADTDGDYFDY